MTSACDKIMHHMKSRGLTLIKEWLVININNMAADRTSLCMDEVTACQVQQPVYVSRFTLASLQN